jgi:hypothetical protein
VTNTIFYFYVRMLNIIYISLFGLNRNNADNDSGSIVLVCSPLISLLQGIPLNHREVLASPMYNARIG